MSSYQLTYALEIAKHLKENHPEIPVVFGGDHAGTEDLSTVESKYCDYAVRGEGEEAVVQIANAFYDFVDIRSTYGLTTKDSDNNVLRNEKAPFIDFNKVNHLPYDLVDLSKYPGLTDKFHYLSSKGCPFSCSFCTWKGNQKVRIKSPEVVIEELAHIVEKYKPRTITFIDGLFFVRVERVERIAELVIERGLPVSFYSMCRVDLFEKVSDKMLATLKKAHFDEIAFGGESGSDTQLKMMSKRTTYAQMIKSAQRSKAAGLMPTYSFMLGLPEELDEHVPQTLKLIDHLKQENPSARCNIMAIFDPYPDAEYTNLVIEKYGYQLPKTFEEWATGKWYAPESKTWIKDGKYKEYQTLQALVRFFYVWDTLNIWDWKMKVARHNGSALFAIVSYILHACLWVPARLRWKTKFFKYGIEIHSWRKLTIMLRGHD